MKKIYNEPQFEVEKFTISNVFTTSGGLEPGENPNPWGEKTQNLEY